MAQLNDIVAIGFCEWLLCANTYLDLKYITLDLYAYFYVGLATSFLTFAQKS